ncbi:MAG TPA: hypothetical protein VFV00_06640 [Acidimicrobiales bacterium]|nr:hypothetical protein [Acidimicrobiales bacterium]
MQHRRFALIVAGVVALLAVAAVVIAHRDTGHARKALPISLGSTPTGSTPTGGAADAALAPYGDITYHADARVPPLDGSARAYRVTPGDPAALTGRLEGALGLHGDPRLVVTDHDWSYNSDPNGTVSSSSSSQPRPTDLLPSEDEAKAAALDLLRRAGLAVDGATVTTDLGDNQWFVRVDPVVDGVPTEGFGASVVVGERGVIVAASGTSGTALAADEYPLAGTKVAVDRLNSGRGLAGPQPLEAQDQPAIATDAAPASTDEPPATDDAVNEGEASAVPADSGAAPPESEPPSTDTIPPPAPQNVTFTGAERILLFVTGSDGTTWLVPAYRFTTADGMGPTVIAVADQALAGGDLPPTGR